MADAAAIGHVSESLQALLRAAITNGGPLPGTQIDLRSPREIGVVTNISLVSLWLYRVRRLDELNNLPPVRLADGRLAMRPLPLTLHYLVTPISGDPLTRQRLLGLAMQALHQQPRLGAEFLHPALLDGVPASIGVHLEPQTTDEMSRIWHALHEPYQLSASYAVQYVPIDAGVSMAMAPIVLDKAATYAAIAEVQ